MAFLGFKKARKVKQAKRRSWKPKKLAGEQNWGSSCSWATQSGPMLLINGAINPEFQENSANLKIRSGVGIIDDRNVVFVISNEPINFYDFALNL